MIDRERRRGVRPRETDPVVTLARAAVVVVLVVSLTALAWTVRAQEHPGEEHGLFAAPGEHAPREGLIGGIPHTWERHPSGMTARVEGFGDIRLDAYTVRNQVDGTINHNATGIYQNGQGPTPATRGRIVYFLWPESDEYGRIVEVWAEFDDGTTDAIWSAALPEPPPEPQPLPGGYASPSISWAHSGPVSDATITVRGGIFTWTTHLQGGLGCDDPTFRPETHWCHVGFIQGTAWIDPRTVGGFPISGVFQIDVCTEGGASCAVIQRTF